MDVPVLRVERRWNCPSCGNDHRTTRGDVHTPLHNCSSLGGLMVPFIDATQHGTHRIHERQDYVGPNQIATRLDDGRLPMSVVTDRDDGQDCTVYAPCAVVRLDNVDPDGPIAALIGVATQSPKEN